MREKLAEAVLFAATVVGFAILMQSQVDAARDEAERAMAALVACEGVCRE